VPLRAAFFAALALASTGEAARGTMRNVSDRPCKD
jgi:hypothetical protein